MPQTTSELLINACNLYITPFLKQEFVKQGHHLTGAWEDSVIAQETGGGEVEIVATAYGMIVDAGITPDRIPYGGEGTGGNGAISQYILALQGYWKVRKPGISDKAALRLAFATAEVQKIEGMSTEASAVHSETGERQHFMETLIALFQDKVDDWVFDGMQVIISDTVKEPKKMYL